MKSILFISVLIISFVLIISGCTKQQIKYVCQDGTTTKDPASCPKQKIVPSAQ